MVLQLGLGSTPTPTQATKASVTAKPATTATATTTIIDTTRANHTELSFKFCIPGVGVSYFHWINLSDQV
jgi:hypothetical protein